MGLSLEAAGDPAVVGFDAGWKMELRKVDSTTHEPVDDGMMTLSRKHYFGQVKVERSAAFRAPTFAVTVEGLSDKDYAKIIGEAFVFVKVLLGWRDLASGGLAPFKDVGSLIGNSDGDDGNYHEVIHGRLTTFERFGGEFRYNTKLTGVDYRFHKLRCTDATQPTVHPGDPARRYAELLGEQAGVTVTTHPSDSPGQAIDEVITVPQDAKVSEALAHVAQSAHGEGADRRIPMFMGMDGLHFGSWRAPISGSPDAAKQLDLRTGLVETRPVVDPDADVCANGPFDAPTVLRFDLVLRGRADLTVGDKVEVEVDVPAPGSLTSTVAGSALGGLGDAAKGIGEMFGAAVEPDYSEFRVVSVSHELDRTKGFVTTLRVERQEDAPADGEAEPVTAEQSRERDEAARTATVLRDQARTRRAEVRLLDVGEVNAQSVEFGESDGHAVAAQRLDIQEGLVRDGSVNSPVRSDRAETPTQLVNKPYLTPYAFGTTGLVVPHYPGTRVVDLHYREDVSQTLVAGCLWKEGAEPLSEFGDYWLSLPTQVFNTETIEDSREAEDPSGPASQDLIDIDGGRAVHVSGLRVSVGSDHLVDVGVRPDNATTDEILIEHKSGARLHIDADGNIEISTSGDITFAANKITMDVSDSVDVT